MIVTSFLNCPDWQIYHATELRVNLPISTSQYNFLRDLWLSFVFFFVCFATAISMLVGVTPKSTLLLNWIREWFGLWMEQRLTVGTSLRIWENHFTLEHVFRWRSALPSNRHSRMRAHKWASTSTAGSSVLLLLSDAKLLPSASSARHSLTKSHTFTIGPQREQKREKKRELPTLFVNIRPIVPRCATQKISFSLSLSNSWSFFFFQTWSTSLFPGTL